MSDLSVFVLFFVITQLFAFLLDFIAWAVRRRHPARIKKSEDVSYPQYLTVFVWHDSHRSHGYQEITYIRKGDNKYKHHINRSVGGWIRLILLDLLCLLITFGLPVAVLIYAPDTPHPELFLCSLIIFFLFLHAQMTGPYTVARIELNRYLKKQSK